MPVRPLTTALLTLVLLPATALEPRPVELGPLIQANTAFALTLYRHLATTQTGDLVMGPQTISQALALVQAGAVGETRAEIDRVQGWTPLRENLHPAWGHLNARLGHAQGVQLNVAARLFLATRSGFLATYIETCRRHHGAEAQATVFDPPEPARELINRWVATQTRDRIPQLFTTRTITPETRGVLVSACYFKGLWQYPFETAATQAQTPFHAAGGDVPCALMQRRAFLSWSEDALVRVARLTFGPRQGPAGAELLLIVPKAVDGLAAVEARLDSRRLATWTSAWRQGMVDLGLPRFTSRSALDLKVTCKALGLVRAFSVTDADLSAMAREPLYIDNVMHQAWIAVDEAGGEAVAVTGITPAAKSDPEAPVPIHADRPFLYLVREAVTGAVLFVGRVTRPQDPGPAGAEVPPRPVPGG